MHPTIEFTTDFPIGLQRSTPYSQLLSLKRIHTEPQYLLEEQIHMYLFFILREYPHDVILRAWMKTNRANPNFKELFSTHWQIKIHKKIGKTGLHDYLQEATFPQRYAGKGKTCSTKNYYQQGLQETQYLQILQKNLPIRENQKLKQQ